MRVPRLEHEIANELDIWPDRHSTEALFLIGAATFRAEFIVPNPSAINHLLICFLLRAELVPIFVRLRQQEAIRRIEVRWIGEASDQPKRIETGKRARQRVKVGIGTTEQSEQIAFDIPSTCRVVIPEDVVCEIRFLVEVLPKESQWELKRTKTRGVFIGRVGSERLSVVVAPDRRTCSVGDKAWRVELLST